MIMPGIRTDEGDEYTLPVLKRKGTWGTSINVIAEMNFAGEDSKEDDWQQIGDFQNYWVDGFEYQLDLAYSYGGPENSRVYVGAPLTLTAKIDPSSNGMRIFPLNGRSLFMMKTATQGSSIRNL